MWEEGDRSFKVTVFQGADCRLFCHALTVHQPGAVWNIFALYFKKFSTAALLQLWESTELYSKRWQTAVSHSWTLREPEPDSSLRWVQNTEWVWNRDVMDNCHYVGKKVCVKGRFIKYWYISHLFLKAIEDISNER